LTFKESDKVTGSSMVFRNNQMPIPSVRTSLHYQSTDGILKLSDGNLVQFADEFSDDDIDDALKYFGGGDNISVYHSGKSFAIEKRKPVQLADTIFYNTTNLRAGNYAIKVNVADWDGTITHAFLLDKYNNTSTVVVLNSETLYPFQVNADIASKASDRFLLVFKNTQLVPLPVKFISVKAAYQNDRDVLVKWTVSNMQQIQKFVIYKSNDGLSFLPIAERNDIINNTPTNDYVFVDSNNVNTTTFYKIGAVESDGSVSFSSVVSVKRQRSVSSFKVYPNPVTNGVIHLVSNNITRQHYQYQLINSLGQVICKGVINASLSMSSTDIHLTENVLPGYYHLKITGNDGTVYQIQVTID